MWRNSSALAGIMLMAAAPTFAQEPAPKQQAPSQQKQACYVLDTRTYAEAEKFLQALPTLYDIPVRVTPEQKGIYKIEMIPFDANKLNNEKIYKFEAATEAQGNLALQNLAVVQETGCTLPGSLKLHAEILLILGIVETRYARAIFAHPENFNDEIKGVYRQRFPENAPQPLPPGLTT